jgi:tripartite-type tricarboxylate transporter receptor subunit TctC
MARNIAEYAKKYFPQPIVVVNKPGATGTVGAYELVKSPPDGYTWLLGVKSELANALHIVKANYTIDDYEVVLKHGGKALVLLVRANDEFQTLKDFVAYAKEHPKELKVAIPGEGSTTHLVAQMLCDAAGIEVTWVPFQGYAPEIPALLGGHVRAAFVSATETISTKGETRGLAVLTPERMSVIPDVPTAKEQGFDVVGGPEEYLVVPKGTPPAVIKVIHDSIKKVLEDPGFLEAAKKIGHRIEYKDGQAAKKELREWYEKSRELYKRLGMIK